MSAKIYTPADVQISNGNFLNRQVCVPKEMDTETATRLLNDKDECGTQNGWVFTEELGEVQCQDDPTKKHMCFHC